MGVGFVHVKFALSRRNDVASCVRGIDIIVHHGCTTTALPCVHRHHSHIHIRLVLWVSLSLHVMVETPAFVDHKGIPWSDQSCTTVQRLFGIPASRGKAPFGALPQRPF